MITAWRLDKETHAKDAFTGEGARRVSGRWHHEGIPVVYISESLALSVLEKFIHLGFDASQIKFVYFKIEIPDSVPIEKLKASDLPADWTREPPRDSTKDIGSKWARKAGTAVLRVPSVLVPRSWNYLLNPAHSDFKKIRISDPMPFVFDARMWKLPY
ncbi:MAG: RES domain-containing protein [Methanothrix sp.]|nr:RES domain-containing protein [Methanothrix sp.]